ncbi:hypothetical protein DYE49_04220 [Treponema rectale]|uniref:DNA repair protein RecN n=1 Tax=Treponema rectale TaxID=744512 RepID=A0A7M1XKK0_9SPIR|nr:hypothetical protein DYE49_04220 [Treponema rectale]
MIEELHIANLAVIEDTTLEFHSRYTALIGETGAGKSLVVNSLLLLTGERSDYSLIRDKSKKAVISGLFHLDKAFISKHEEIAPYVDEQGELIVKRVLNPDKTGRCYLNDEIVSLNEFKTATNHLIDIHSQNAKNDLLDEMKQIRYVDEYLKDEIAKAKKDYQVSYTAYLDAKEDLKNLLEQDKELDRDYLSFQIAEIEKYHLQENEIEDLNSEYESLRGYDKLKEKYDNFLVVSESGQGSLSERLSSSVSSLRGLKDTDLAPIAELCLDDVISLQEHLRDLDMTFKDMSNDPRRLDYINERLFNLKGLQRKYGKSTKEILDKLNDYKEKLNRLDFFEDEKIRLEEVIKAKEKELALKAETLTSLRIKAGEELSLDIGKEMSSLGLRKNAFRVEVKNKDYSLDGKDNVTFKVSLNEGLDENSLAKAASGGESSRLMLALKVVLNALDPYDVLVFDEIDTGISGKTASLVAKKIKSISKDSPLIVISHLPQVVASSNSAVYIEKKSKDNMTSSVSKTLKDKEIRDYVARMLSGDKVTPAALSQADELIKEYQA